MGYNPGAYGAYGAYGAPHYGGYGYGTPAYPPVVMPPQPGYGYPPRY